jgi:hypothetical protein
LQQNPTQPLRLHTFLCFLIFTFFTEEVFAANFLEKNVTLRMQERRMSEVLQNLASQVGCRLSYNPEVVDENRKVTLSVNNVRLREALQQLLGDNFQFRERDEFVTIRKLKTGERVIGGYISDEKTGKKVDKATVYDKKTLRSATTDQYGYYEIVSREPIKELSVARTSYGDTTFQIRSMRSDTPQYLDLALLPKPDFFQKNEPEESEEPDTTNAIKRVTDKFNEYRERVLLDFSGRDLERFANNYSNGFQQADVDNLQKAGLRRGFQWSIAPYAGNNGGLSGSVTNNFALNMTVGYSRGNRVLEIGGIGNINRETLTGVQLASLFNLTGESRGIQVSSMLNRAKILRGVQLSGLINTTQNLQHGVQVAAITNQARRSKGGFQVAGLVNKAKRGTTAVQIATISNSADTVAAQIGLVNTARHLRGVQIGLINVCDTASGIVLGLINSVKRGYNTFEISTFDGKLANVAFKTGTSRFYTSYIASIRTDSSFLNNQVWGIGMGFGTSQKLTNRLSLTLDATAQHFSIGQFNTAWGSSNLIRVAPVLSVRLGQRLQIFGGTSRNWFYAKTNPLTLEQVADYRQKLTPTEGVTASGDWRRWWGWYAGLRFF